MEAQVHHLLHNRLIFILSDNDGSFEKIQTSQAMEAVDVLLNFYEQENFDFHDIGVRKMK